MERRPTDSSSQQSSQHLGVQPGGLDDRSPRLSSLDERHHLHPHVLDHGDLTGRRILSAHHSSPLVETVQDEEENTVGELIAAAELANEQLTAPSATDRIPVKKNLV